KYARKCACSGRWWGRMLMPESWRKWPVRGRGIGLSLRGLPRLPLCLKVHPFKWPGKQSVSMCISGRG
ncbi:uncharacterized protein METZ01_LOCUS476786, partial [marine metagenome]